MEGWKRREIRKGRGKLSGRRYGSLAWQAEMYNYVIQDLLTTRQMFGFNDNRIAEEVLGDLGYVSFKGIMNSGDISLYEKKVPGLEFAESVRAEMDLSTDKGRKYWDLANPSVGDGS